MEREIKRMIKTQKSKIVKQNKYANKTEFQKIKKTSSKIFRKTSNKSKNLASAKSSDSSNTILESTESIHPKIKLHSDTQFISDENEKHTKQLLNEANSKVLGTYNYFSGKIPITVTIAKEPGEFVPIYQLHISAISKTTEMILEKVRLELIKRVSLRTEDLGDTKKTNLIEDKFQELIDILIEKYFPDSDEDTSNFLKTYLKMNSLGLGNLELLMNDETLEEVVVNEASEPVWVYHKKYGWLKTTIFLKNEEQTRHYATIIGRKVGRQITVLTPLLDAHLNTGDRVNATLNPISTEGNTITIRKFSKDPWTITNFLKTKTLTFEAAALIWMAIQYELSSIIAGGTASGKTSALNVFSSFFPPNQRIISIEDTREIVLPKFLHWVPLNTALSNAEGKGEVSMEDLLVNSLRMRPDRILVGEVRRKREAETLFEAIHTGHSVYATFHANSAKETVERLTNAPIDIPRIMLPAISMIVVQFRNRRSGVRRTFQIAEILSTGEANVILQYDAKKDMLVQQNKSKALYENISMFTGMDESDINKDLQEKIKVLKYLVEKSIGSVNDVGRIMAEYYTEKENLMKYVNSNKDFPFFIDLSIKTKINEAKKTQEDTPVTLEKSEKSKTLDPTSDHNSDHNSKDASEKNNMIKNFSKNIEKEEEDKKSSIQNSKTHSSILPNIHKFLKIPEKGHNLHNDSSKNPK